MGMSLSRRDFLKLSTLVASTVTLSACSPTLYQRLAGGTKLTPWLPIDPADFQALSRMTFGPRTEERSDAARSGLQAWIEEQLSPSSIDDLNCSLRLQAFDTLNMQAHDLADLSSRLLGNADRTRVPDELRQATLVRQVFSRRQLYKRRAEYWTVHSTTPPEIATSTYIIPRTD